MTRSSRVSTRVLLVASLVIAGCGSGASHVDPTTAPPPFAAGSTREPLATEAPAPTAAPAEHPSPAPTGRPLVVKVTALTRSVQQNTEASVTINTTAGATCDIDVEYYSGAATARGLGNKKATSTGTVTWKWKVGSNTKPATWPISISCEKSGRSGSADTSFTVR